MKKTSLVVGPSLLLGFLTGCNSQDTSNQDEAKSSKAEAYEAQQVARSVDSALEAAVYPNGPPHRSPAPILITPKDMPVQRSISDLAAEARERKISEQLDRIENEQMTQHFENEMGRTQSSENK